ncbi:MAG: aminodeoxychorismate synthase, component I [Desulfobulbaceae bacterium DB1]|nr:MAG: aminodeoxychorismate synthase, component I [Desulfobulbaceae bacterium DB1]
MTNLLPFSEHDISRLLSARGHDDFILLESMKLSEENQTSLLFSDPVDTLVLHGHDDPRIFFTQAQEWLDRGFYLAGWFAYELGYLLEPALTALARPRQLLPLARLGVFRKPIIFDHADRLSISSALAAFAPDEGIDAGTDTLDIGNLRLNLAESEYIEAIETIRRYIAAGDTYQVNYTLKYLFDFAGKPSDLYRTLRRNQTVAYGAFLRHGERHILSFSPELFFRRRGNRCTVRPMKGTMRRGRTSLEDEKNRHFLQTDSKNRSENVMIVDLLRNDLGRLSKPGTVRVASLFDVETYETLHQMTSTITGELPDKVRLYDLFKALFPCGSVTGAPKIRTMEIIRQLEREPRGVYTGAIGYIAPHGDAAFNVPIRTIVLDRDQGEMGVGSGIVHDSNPESEWQECQLKGNFLSRPLPPFQLIETLLWRAGEGFRFFEEHLARLVDSAAYFQIPCNPEQIRQLFSREHKRLEVLGGCHRCRLLLNKDDGGLSLTATPCDEPKGLEQAGEEPAPQVRFSSQQTDSADIFLCHKTTRRDLYDRERHKATAEGYYEVLFCNEKGEVTEGAITSVFVRQGDIFFTPPVACGLLPGVYRNHFLTKTGFTVIEKILFPEDLARADAVYVANSVRGMVRVRI